METRQRARALQLRMRYLGNPNATTIDSTLNYIKSKQQEQHKRLALDPNSNDDNNNGKGQLTTGRQTAF